MTSTAQQPTLTQRLVAEIQNEAQTTRRLIQAIPVDQLQFRAHEKSHTLGGLASHIATVTSGIIDMAAVETCDASDISAEFDAPDSVGTVLETFDASTKKALDFVGGLDDEQLDATWTLTAGGKTIMTMSRYDVIRNILMNHIYHHRGQLGVYLRLAGAKVPSTYGPSGDEPPVFMQ